MNIKKTKILPYFSKRQGNFLLHNQVKIDNQGLECVDNYTYLGIKVDSSLTMSKHIDHLFNSALIMVFTLCKIRPYIDTHTAILIFKAHILSRIEYGSVFCIGANKSSLDRLQKLVNRSLRICLRKPRDSSVFGLHTEAKVLPLRIRRNIVLMKLLYKLAYKGQEAVSRVTGARTRSTASINLPIPFPKTEWFRRNIAYQGPSRWLNLPTFLRNIVAMEEFGVGIKKWYIESFVQEGVV